MYPWNIGAWRQLLARRENLPQALLIHGPRGVGKLALARQFAQVLLCEKPEPDMPCGRCEGCRWYLAGQHPDFRQIEPEVMAAPQVPADDAPAPSKTTKPSHEIKVDQIRELTDFLNIGSHRGKLRLALFHPAETMNANAANSLLKSLEDPASGACFILISNNHMGLLPTIRSRCISFPVGLPDASKSLAWLEKEGVASASDWLAYAGGSPLLARELAESERGEKLGKLIALLKGGGKAALLTWPATDREHIEALSEVLQKWAYDKVLGEFSDSGNFFGRSESKAERSTSKRQAWIRFALVAGRYRVAARHPLNPKLFATDLISRMPD